VILDEIQNTPELFAYIRTLIDQEPRNKGKWILTGSQEAPLMQNVTESLAGRAALFTLLPFSHEETSDVSLLYGGFPEVIEFPQTADIWFSSYIQTYLERDIRSIAAIRDLATFRRFISLLATRCGQMLNKTNLAAPLGVSVPTLTQWLGLLEITGQIILVTPYFENYGKRLVKTPKLYFTDPGLAASLLGIRDTQMLDSSPFKGALFEGLVASEIIKHRLNRGLARNLYYFRDREGLEVDFIVDKGDARLLLLEAKATKTPMPDDGRSLHRLLQAIASESRATASAFVVHENTRELSAQMPLRKDVSAISWPLIHTMLS